MAFNGMKKGFTNFGNATAKGLTHAANATAKGFNDKIKGGFEEKIIGGFKRDIIDPYTNRSITIIEDENGTVIDYDFYSTPSSITDDPVSVSTSTEPDFQNETVTDLYEGVYGRGKIKIVFYYICSDDKICKNGFETDKISGDIGMNIGNVNFDSLIEYYRNLNWNFKCTKIQINGHVDQNHKTIDLDYNPKKKPSLNTVLSESKNKNKIQKELILQDPAILYINKQGYKEFFFFREGSELINKNIPGVGDETGFRNHKMHICEIACAFEYELTKTYTMKDIKTEDILNFNNPSCYNNYDSLQNCLKTETIRVTQINQKSKHFNNEKNLEEAMLNVCYGYPKLQNGVVVIGDMSKVNAVTGTDRYRQNCSTFFTPLTIEFGEFNKKVKPDAALTGICKKIYDDTHDPIEKTRLLDKYGLCIDNFPNEFYESLIDKYYPLENKYEIDSVYGKDTFLPDTKVTRGSQLTSQALNNQFRTKLSLGKECVPNMKHPKTCKFDVNVQVCSNTVEFKSGEWIDFKDVVINQVNNCNQNIHENNVRKEFYIKLSTYEEKLKALQNMKTPGKQEIIMLLNMYIDTFPKTTIVYSDTTDAAEKKDQIKYKQNCTKLISDIENYINNWKDNIMRDLLYEFQIEKNNLNNASDIEIVVYDPKKPFESELVKLTNYKAAINTKLNNFGTVSSKFNNARNVMNNSIQTWNDVIDFLKDKLNSNINFLVTLGLQSKKNIDSSVSVSDDLLKKKMSDVDSILEIIKTNMINAKSEEDRQKAILHLKNVQEAQEIEENKRKQEEMKKKEEEKKIKDELAIQAQIQAQAQAQAQAHANAQAQAQAEAQEKIGRHQLTQAQAQAHANAQAQAQAEAQEKIDRHQPTQTQAKAQEQSPTQNKSNETQKDNNTSDETFHKTEKNENLESKTENLFTRLLDFISKHPLVCLFIFIIIVSIVVIIAKQKNEDTNESNHEDHEQINQYQNGSYHDQINQYQNGSYHNINKNQYQNGSYHNINKNHYQNDLFLDQKNNFNNLHY